MPKGTGKENSGQYDITETERRFEAALHGARIAGARHKPSVVSKRNRKQQARKPRPSAPKSA